MLGNTAITEVILDESLSKTTRLLFVVVMDAAHVDKRVPAIKKAGFSKAAALKGLRELVESGVFSEAVLHEIQSAFEARKRSPEAIKDEDTRVNQLFTVFYEGGNKAVPFGNTAERKAALALIRERGFSEAVRLATLALEACGQPYAPVITTPAMLWRKLKALEAWEARKAVETTKKGGVRSI